MNKILLGVACIVAIVIFLSGCSLVHFVEGDYEKNVVPLTKAQLKSKLNYEEPDSIKSTNKFGADEVWTYHKKIYNKDKVNYVLVDENFYFKKDALVAKEP